MTVGGAGDDHEQPAGPEAHDPGQLPGRGAPAAQPVQLHAQPAVAQRELVHGAVPAEAAFVPAGAGEDQRALGGLHQGERGPVAGHGPVRHAHAGEAQEGAGGRVAEGLEVALGPPGAQAPDALRWAGQGHRLGPHRVRWVERVADRGRRHVEGLERLTPHRKEGSHEGTGFEVDADASIGLGGEDQHPQLRPGDCDPVPNFRPHGMKWCPAAPAKWWMVGRTARGDVRSLGRRHSVQAGGRRPALPR